MVGNPSLFLNNNAWLNTLPDNVKSELIKAAKIKSFLSNQRICSKADEPEGLYCVVTGEVRVGETTINGNEFVFTRVEAGQWFGEIAILDNGPRTHDCIAVTETKIAIIPTVIIQNLCKTNFEIYHALVQMLCTHCRLAFQAIGDLVLSSNEQRLANILVNKVSVSGRFIVRVTQEELGSQIGISRQSTNKILKAWERKSWIKRVYKGLEVQNLEALTAMCNA